ncbi:MAG TPA: DUF1326 domain-containing protein [Terriglobales bacterium]|nr:DUF1326 domain-containing protein [Terriglobales bacterium]
MTRISFSLGGLTTLVALASLLSVSAQAKITGEYVESRSTDVYTGQCFANGEVGLTGDEAIIAWHIRSGRWEGVKLDGFSVVAAVKANATLGDPYADPYPAKSVVIVDERANPQERAALAAFAKHMGGKLLANVANIVTAPVEVQVQPGHHGSASVKAGDFLTVQTRGISDNDHLCGNESTFYQPLTQVSHAMPAVAMTDSYSGRSLGRTWMLHDKRSAFVGSF